MFASKRVRWMRQRWECREGEVLVDIDRDARVPLITLLLARADSALGYFNFQEWREPDGETA